MKNCNSKEAFTLLELVFVIVVIGILATVAAPRLWVTRDDAIISKGRADVATIRSAISTYKQKQLLEAKTPLYPDTLDSAAKNKENEPLFSNILDYPVYSSKSEGKWMKTGDRQYKYSIQGDKVSFDYNKSNGKFDCDHTDKWCRELTH